MRGLLRGPRHEVIGPLPARADAAGAEAAQQPAAAAAEAVLLVPAFELEKGGRTGAESARGQRGGRGGRRRRRRIH